MNVYGIRPETLHCQGNVPLPKEWEKVNRGRHILIAHVASERPEQRFRVDGRLADLTAALRGPDAWLRLHPVVQAPPVDPLQLAPAGAGLYQIVRQQRAVFAIADATRRLLLSAVFRAVAWRLESSNPLKIARSVLRTRPFTPVPDSTAMKFTYVQNSNAITNHYRGPACKYVRLARKCARMCSLRRQS